MKTQNKQHKALNKSLANQSLGKSLVLLSEICPQAYSDRFNAIESTYKMMLNYLFTGTEDPSQKDVFQHLLKDTYELADDCYAININKIKSRNRTFNALWEPSRYTEENIKLCHALLSSDNIFECQLAVSAVTLNCLELFDETKLLCLFDFANHDDETVSLRALTGIILILSRNTARLKFYPKIYNRLNLIFDNDKHIKNARTIVIQLIRSKETEEITKDITENIIPSISKLSPDLQKKMREIDFDSDDFEEQNYEWQDMLADSKIADKMQKYSELQQGGSDINMSTFSHLKNFPFFQEIENWFMPFSAQHPAITAVFSDQNTEDEALIETMRENKLLCDSDKYSFFINLGMLNKEFRKGMLSQLKLESEQLKSLSSKEDSSSISNSYLQDLYRFYKLFPQKNEFVDVFTLNYDVHNMPFFRFLNQENSFLPKIADYFFAKKQYNNALSAYIKLIDVSKLDAELYQKIGLCFQKNKQYSEATEYYQKAELIDTDNAWTLRKLAYCYRKLENYEQALSFYLQLEKIEKDNLNLLFNIGRCYLETTNYETALNYFFKIEFFDTQEKHKGRIHLYAGICLWCTGKREDALIRFLKYPSKHEIEKVLKRTPSISDQHRNFIIDYLSYKE